MLLSVITDAIETDLQLTIGNHNLHSLYLLRYDPAMREFFALADLIYIDGMPLILCAKLLGVSLQRRHRVTFLDIVDDFMRQAASTGWRIFLLGSRPGVAERAATALIGKYPELVLETASGYFDATIGSADNDELIEQIQAFRPHAVLIGMGMPRQERWVLENGGKIDANVTIVLGGILDYLCGDTVIPPRVLGRIGLEGFFRLLSEPRRLWRRYLVEPWFVLGPIGRDIVRRRRSLTARARHR